MIWHPRHRVDPVIKCELVFFRKSINCWFAFFSQFFSFLHFVSFYFFYIDPCCFIMICITMAGREHVIFHITVPKCHWNLNFFAVLNMNELSPCFVVNFFVNHPTQFVFSLLPLFVLFCVSSFPKENLKYMVCVLFVRHLIKNKRNCIIIWILLFFKALSLPKIVQKNKLDYYCHLG